MREGVLLSALVHAVILAVILFGPELAFLKTDPAEIEARQQELERLQRERERQAQRFVFVQPRTELPPLKASPRPELSDLDRSARSPEKAPSLENPLPRAEGNSRERVEASPDERMRGEGPAPKPSPPKESTPKRSRIRGRPGLARLSTKSHSRAALQASTEPYASTMVMSGRECVRSDIPE